MNDGNWERLFDERGAERSDRMDTAWRAHAEQYWTDPQLGFVRAGEAAREGDAKRTPPHGRQGRGASIACEALGGT